MNYNNPYIQNNKIRIWEFDFTAHSDFPGSFGLDNRINHLEILTIKMKETDQGLFSTEELLWKMTKKAKVKYIGFWFNGEFLHYCYPSLYSHNFKKKDTLIIPAGGLTFTINNIPVVRTLIFSGLGSSLG